MTRKDYQALAEALYRTRQTRKAKDWTVASDVIEGITQAAFDAVVLELAHVFAADNPRFDRETFVRACEDGNVVRYQHRDGCRRAERERILDFTKPYEQMTAKEDA